MRPPVVYLTDEQALFLHSRMVDATGGSHGVRDIGLLASAVARLRAAFSGEDLYPTLPSKAASLFDSLVRNHPFVDGNKRTGLTAVGIFLDLNGRHLTADNDAAKAFTLRVATAHLAVEEIAAWLETHSKPVANEST